MLTLGLTLGDVTGIGPEVLFKALPEIVPEDDTRYVLIGDRCVIREYMGYLGVGEELPRWIDAPGGDERLLVHDPSQESLPPLLEAGDPEAALASLGCLREAARLCLEGSLDGMVTAPVNKESIIAAGCASFVGQTELLSALAGVERTAMMLVGADDRERWLRVALVTNHVPLKDVAARLERSRIETVAGLAREACALLGLPRARLGVCGLNPHAGEGGRMGTEEKALIEPAVAALRAAGLDVEGPVAADALFHRAYRGEFDVVVAMYHDQGLVPLKMIAFETGVNWTLGLPFVRTSPDHGTAYNIAGRGIANPGSMKAAIRLARRLAAGRRSGQGP